MATIAATAHTCSAVVDMAKDSTAVSWGVQGASPDGYTILAADDGRAVERLQGAVRFAQSRVAGRPGCWVVWGLPDDVHALVYDEYDRARELARRHGC